MLKWVLGDELNARVRELGTVSDSDSFFERRFMGPGWTRAASLLHEWMEDAGLEVWMDEIGNVHGRTPASATMPGPALLMGSHFDAVKHGGIYDGSLGVVA